MKSRKTKALVVLVLLALGSACLFPSVTAAGKEKGIAGRVEVLEQQVADLIARVEALEGGSYTCTCDVMHLEPLSDFPDNPSEGDLCIVTLSDGRHYLYIYLNGGWRWLITGPPGPGPEPEPWSE